MRDKIIIIIQVNFFVETIHNFALLLTRYFALV